MQNPKDEELLIQTVKAIVSKDVSEEAKMEIIKFLFKQLSPDSMVDFTDYANKKMEDVVSLKAELSAKILGKKAGELFDAAREKVEGLANTFSQEMKRWNSDDNPMKKN